MNTVAIFTANARRFARKPFLIDGEVRFTYGEMADRVRRVAGRLQQLGLLPGDVVGLYCRNRHEWVELFYAVSLVGGVICPVNFRLSSVEAQYVISDSGARFLAYDRTVIPALVDAVVGRVPAVSTYVHLDEPCPGVPSTPYADLVAGADAGPVAPVPHTIAADDRHMIVYTAGTTGRPKGAILTHANNLIHNYSSHLELGLRADERVLVSSPLCHRTGFGRLIPTACSGATAVLVREFRPEAVIDLIEREHTEIIGIVPTMVRMLLRLPDLKERRLDHVRLILMTGEACPLELKAALTTFFPNAKLFSYYASTEAAQVTSLRPEDQFTHPKSVGHPLPGVDVIVVDGQGQPLPPGESGEIWIRSGRPGQFTIMQGYLNNPTANRDSFVGDWFRSGDGGWFDGDGYLYFSDRIKDMILSGGLNIYSKEVEQAIAQHSGVLEVAVVGVPDPDWGESVVAFVVPVAGTTLSASEIIDFCRRHLASYKKPRHVRFLPELPKNSVGKIQKFQLRELAAAEFKEGTRT